MKMDMLRSPFEFGQISVTLGSVLVFLFSIWVSLWLAKMIRIVLRDEVLPNIELPHERSNWRLAESRPPISRAERIRFRHSRQRTLAGLRADPTGCSVVYNMSCTIRRAAVRHHDHKDSRCTLNATHFDLLSPLSSPPP